MSRLICATLKGTILYALHMLMIRLVQQTLQTLRKALVEMVGLRNTLQNKKHALNVLGSSSPIRLGLSILFLWTLMQ